jgi:hypothetical protein
MKILLDIFHAEQRLTLGLNKHHCDFPEYLSMIRDCFLKIDEGEFAKLVASEAEKRHQDRERVRFDLRTREWSWVRKRLPMHIPPKRQLEEELDRVLARAKKMHDVKYGYLLTKETIKVSSPQGRALLWTCVLS